MELKNNDQNSVIFSIAEILSKMSNQVGFLIRNDKLMSQLDVDILMDNTRKLYDTICSVRCNMDADSIPMEVESNEGTGTEVGDVDWNFTDDDDIREDDVEKDIVEKEDEDTEIRNEELDAEVNDVELMIEDIKGESDEEVIKFDFEIPSDETPYTDTFQEDVVEEDDEDENEAQNEDSGIRAYRKINNEYFTLGDKLEQTEDNSLVTRLQRKPVTDLTNAIGINDKFLLLNELFSGSMEKYNKSIRALNNFSTLLGAKTYLGELQIELQWNCESEAYKKLADLVERRFI